MKDIDDKIREALRKEDSELWEHYREEPAIYEIVMETFRGRFRWLNVLAFTGSIIILGLLCLLAYLFFHAESTQAMIAYATGFVWGVIWIAMLKIWFWLEMNKNSVTREVKRLELQLANLSRRMSDKGTPV
jgi:uncharacterized membrane protein YciS (DUF1049 family)